mgnify:CR=1 FL=1
MKKTILLGAGILIFVILAVGSVGGSSSSYDSSAKKKEENTKTNTASNSEPEKEEVKGYKEGMYKVGSDIPAGEYVLFADNSGNGYYERNEDSGGDSIIDNDNFSTFVYVNFKDGEYAKIANSRAVSSSEITESLAKDGITKGTYKVGKDIEAGEYKIVSEGDTYWERTDKDGEIIDNDNFENTAYVTLKNGEYFKLTDGKAEKVK